MEDERYHRQIILEGFGPIAQQKLAKAKVLVVGAGGLGCPALQYLAAAGIGLIGIIDNDTVALSNLHRQILYTSDDLGQLKVVVAKQRLQLMNPGIEVVIHPLRLNAQNILQILESYDVILDGTDNFDTRYLINDACALLKKPLVFAAVSGFEGQLSIFNVTDDQGIRTNYRDLFPVPPLPGEVPNCADNGVLGVLPGIIGTMAASETIKFISNTGKPLINKLLHYNLLNNQQYELKISPARDYELPQTEAELLNKHTGSLNTTEETYSEITGTDLQRMQEEPSTILIDVRERHEQPGLNTTVFRQTPMSEFRQFMETDIEENNIIVICQHGIRSAAAAKELSRKYGNTKNIFSLKGGIVKWYAYF